MESAETGTGARRHDLDWLRILVIGLLIPFHTAIMFDDGADFYVKNDVPSRFLTEAANLIGLSGMLLLFFVAGAAGWFALRKYRWGDFVKERAGRLILPLIASLLTILPLMGYFGRRHHTGIRESFWAYYPRFITGGGDNVTGFTGDLSPGHLWFILFLFILTLLALPIFAWLKSAAGQRFAARVAGVMSRPGGLLLVPFVLLVLDAIPEIAGRGVGGFFFYLVAGFLWMSHPRFQESVDRQRYFLLIVCLATAVLFLLFRIWGERQSGFSLGSAAFDLLRNSYAWTTVMTLLGFAHSGLNRPGRVIRYLGPASYPLYIIHLPVVITLGYFLVRGSAGPAAKFLAITAGSFAVTLLVYEVLVRRIPFVGRALGIPARHSLQR